MVFMKEVSKRPVRSEKGDVKEAERPNLLHENIIHKYRHVVNIFLYKNDEIIYKNGELCF